MSFGSCGTFTLSLDCEGLWGMADDPALIASGVINDDSLKASYDHILAILDQCGIKATAAFVSAFAADSDVLHDNLQLVGELARREPRWFSSILKALAMPKANGWHGAGYYHAMAASGFEMAWHGTTHLSLGDRTSDASIELELELTDQLHATLGTKPTSLVFPRNEIGHLNTLRRAGFRNYRDSLDGKGVMRAAQLLSELNVFATADPNGGLMRGDWYVCRPGHFLNWPAGVRALVPPAVTIRRWRAMLRDAAATGGSVHMWFHPHNLTTAPAMKIAFDEILHFAGELVTSGDLVSLTMGELAERMQSEFCA